VVEKCEENSERWEKVPGVVSGTSHTVPDLKPTAMRPFAKPAAMRPFAE